MATSNKSIESAAKALEVNNRLDSMYSEGRKRISQVRGMARDAIRYVYGDQHAGRVRKSGWEYPVLNRMYADMMQEVAILGTSRISIETLPAEDSDEEAAKAIGAILNAKWFRELSMDIKTIQMIIDKSLWGFAIIKWLWEDKVEWDEEKAQKTGDGWKGKISVNVISPEYFGCDPDVELAADIPTKARYVYTSRFIDKSYAARLWPKYASYLVNRGEMSSDGVLLPKKSDSSGIPGASGLTTDESGFNRSTAEWSGKEIGVVGTKYEAMLQARLSNIILGADKDGNSVGLAENRDTVEVQEFLFRDYSTERVPATYEPIPFGEPGTEHIVKQNGVLIDTSRKNENPLPGIDSPFMPADQEHWPTRVKVPAYRRPKYPNGRRVVRIIDGEKIVVVDEKWPYKSWNFSVVPHYMLSHMWIGVNSVEVSRGFQDWMNHIGSNLLNYVKFFADPQLWVEEGALAKSKKHKYGNVVPNWPGAIVRFVKGALRSGAAQRKEPPMLPPSLFQIFELFKSADQDIKGAHDVMQGRASKGTSTLGELQMLDRNSRQRLALQGVLLDKTILQVAEGVIELMQTHYEENQWVRYVGNSKGMLIGSMQWSKKLADVKYDIKIEPIATLPFDKEREALKYREAMSVAGPSMLRIYLEKLGISNIDEIMAKHEIMGPLEQLMEISQSLGMGPQELMQAIEKQLELEKSVVAPEPSQPGPAKGTPRPPRPPQQ